VLLSVYFAAIIIRGGGEDTTFKVKAKAKNEVAEDRCLEVKKRKARGQGQGLEDTFENTQKYKWKH